MRSRPRSSEGIHTRRIALQQASNARRKVVVTVQVEEVQWSARRQTGTNLRGFCRAPLSPAVSCNSDSSHARAPSERARNRSTTESIPILSYPTSPAHNRTHNTSKAHTVARSKAREPFGRRPPPNEQVRWVAHTTKTTSLASEYDAKSAMGGICVLSYRF